MDFLLHAGKVHVVVHARGRPDAPARSLAASHRERFAGGVEGGHVGDELVVGLLAIAHWDSARDKQTSRAGRIAGQFDPHVHACPAGCAVTQPVHHQRALLAAFGPASNEDADEQGNQKQGTHGGAGHPIEARGGSQSAASVDECARHG